METVIETLILTITFLKIRVDIGHRASIDFCKRVDLSYLQSTLSNIMEGIRLETSLSWRANITMETLAVGSLPKKVNKKLCS